MLRFAVILALAVSTLAACGGGASPVRAASVRQVLTGMPELLELETPSARQELFREVARGSLAEAGNAATPLVLFPITVDGRLVAAPGLSPNADLLVSPDARNLVLRLDVQTDPWPEDRRDSLQGLSERETAELVGRSLLTHWGIHSDAEIVVERASGAPYAAAYVDGLLRLNPSFLYLAASVTPGASQ